MIGKPIEKKQMRGVGSRVADYPHESTLNTRTLDTRLFSIVGMISYFDCVAYLLSNRPSCMLQLCRGLRHYEHHHTK